MTLQDELKKQVNGIFQELGLGNLSAEEQEKIRQKIIDRLDRVVLEATILSLNEEQLKEFEAALSMDDEKDAEALITELTSQVPGLSARIDMALRTEWEGIKKSIAQTV